jgi:hypothetical protein
MHYWTNTSVRRSATFHGLTPIPSTPIPSTASAATSYPGNNLACWASSTESHKKLRLAGLPPLGNQVRRINQYISLSRQCEDRHLAPLIVCRHNPLKSDLIDQQLSEREADGVDRFVDPISIGFVCGEPPGIGAVENGSGDRLSHVRRGVRRHELLGIFNARSDPLPLGVVEFLNTLHDQSSPRRTGEYQTGRRWMNVEPGRRCSPCGQVSTSFGDAGRQFSGKPRKM